MIRKLRKGFTIVELVIVVAVIAVLTAVLIPTFIHLSKKAKTASDNSLVANLNTALKMDVADGHAEPKTMQDAVDAVKRQGYLVPQLSTKSEEKLVYSIEKNEFCLSDKVEAGEEYKYWHIEQGGMPSTQLFSIYAFEWTATEATGLTVGFDAGEEGINNVEYVGGHNVVIRTNGGALNITAPLNSVKHYGKADSLNITAIAGSSYHEFGEVGYAKIANGRLVIEEEAIIDGIYLVANSSGDFDGIKLAIVGKAELPTLGRANVESGMADNTSKLVVEIQTLTSSEGTDDNPEYVWITKNGAEVTSTVSSSSTDVSAVVTQPSAAASTVKEEAKESIEPISDNSVARIKVTGYESFKSAVESANKGEKIYILKDFELSNGIGHYSNTTIYSGLYEGSLANEVVLTKDTTITLSSNSQIVMTVGGRINVGDHKLNFVGNSSDVGIINCQQIVDKDGNRDGISVDGKTATITKDLYFNLDPAYAPLTFNLMCDGSTWAESSGFGTGSYMDHRALASEPTSMGERSVNDAESVVLSVEAVDGATYAWSQDQGDDAHGNFVGSQNGQSATFKGKYIGLGGDFTLYVFCDVFKPNGTWYRYYWSITVKASGGGTPPPIWAI